jgi:hypothetical protein
MKSKSEENSGETPDRTRRRWLAMGNILFGWRGQLLGECSRITWVECIQCQIQGHDKCTDGVSWEHVCPSSNSDVSYENY